MNCLSLCFKMYLKIYKAGIIVMKKSLFILFFVGFTSSLYLFANEAGASIYNKKCVHCHGIDGANKAFGISRPLSEMPPQEIKDKLKYYTTTNASRSLKGVSSTMNKQATRLSDEDFNFVLQYLTENISKIKAE